MNKQIEPLIAAIARQYLDRYGNQYRHADVCLPLGMDVLTAAVETQIVGNLLIQYGGKGGRFRVLVFLTAMFTDGELNDWGVDMLDFMLRCFCEDVRHILDAGHVPAKVLGRSADGVQ